MSEAKEEDPSILNEKDIDSDLYNVNTNYMQNLNELRRKLNLKEIIDEEPEKDVEKSCDLLPQKLTNITSEQMTLKKKNIYKEKEFDSRTSIRSNLHISRRETHVNLSSVMKLEDVESEDLSSIDANYFLASKEERYEEGVILNDGEIITPRTLEVPPKKICLTNSSITQSLIKTIDDEELLDEEDDVKENEKRILTAPPTFSAQINTKAHDKQGNSKEMYDRYGKTAHVTMAKDFPIEPPCLKELKAYTKDSASKQCKIHAKNLPSFANLSQFYVKQHITGEPPYFIKEPLQYTKESYVEQLTNYAKELSTHGRETRSLPKQTSFDDGKKSSNLKETTSLEESTAKRSALLDVPTANSKELTANAKVFTLNAKESITNPKRSCNVKKSLAYIKETPSQVKKSLSCINESPQTSFKESHSQLKSSASYSEKALTSTKDSQIQQRSLSGKLVTRNLRMLNNSIEPIAIEKKSVHQMNQRISVNETSTNQKMLPDLATNNSHWKEVDESHNVHASRAFELIGNRAFEEGFHVGKSESVEGKFSSQSVKDCNTKTVIEDRCDLKKKSAEYEAKLSLESATKEERKKMVQSESSTMLTLPSSVIDTKNSSSELTPNVRIITLINEQKEVMEANVRDEDFEYDKLPLLLRKYYERTPTISNISTPNTNVVSSFEPSSERLSENSLMSHDDSELMVDRTKRETLNLCLNSKLKQYLSEHSIRNSNTKLHNNLRGTNVYSDYKMNAEKMLKTKTKRSKKTINYLISDESSKMYDIPNEVVLNPFDTFDKDVNSSSTKSRSLIFNRKQQFTNLNYYDVTSSEDGLQEDTSTTNKLNKNDRIIEETDEEIESNILCAKCFCFNFFRR